MMPEIRGQEISESSGPEFEPVRSDEADQKKLSPEKESDPAENVDSPKKQQEADGPRKLESDSDKGEKPHAKKESAETDSEKLDQLPLEREAKDGGADSAERPEKDAPEKEKLEPLKQEAKDGETDSAERPEKDAPEKEKLEPLKQEAKDGETDSAERPEKDAPEKEKPEPLDREAKDGKADSAERPEKDAPEKEKPEPLKQEAKNGEADRAERPEEDLEDPDYKARIDRTPILAENGHWDGDRGESKWIPHDAGVQETLRKNGIDGIEYKDGYPDFSPVSKCDLFLDPEDYMQSDTKQFRECNDFLSGMIDEYPETARLFGEDQLMDIAEGITPEGYTWHHATDRPGHMQLVPTDVHQSARHSGGRSLWGGGAENR